MARALSLDPEPYVPKADESLPEAERTTFYMKNLSHQKWGALMRDIGGKDGDSINLAGTAASEILKTSLTGWDNFLDGWGNPIAWEKSIDANLNRIPAGLRMELALEVINRNGVSEALEKN